MTPPKGYEVRGPFNGEWDALKDTKPCKTCGHDPRMAYRIGTAKSEAEAVAICEKDAAK